MNSTLDELLTLPWTLEAQAIEDDEGGYMEVRIGELPGFLLCVLPGQSFKSELRDALAAFLGSYLECDELPPLPKARLRLLPSAKHSSASRPAMWQAGAMALG